MFRSLLGTFTTRRRRHKSHLRPNHRQLRLEPLESRQLLSADTSLVSPAAQTAPVLRIINGTPTSAWEGVGLLGDTSGYFCSGVLIAPQYVLTAGHCAVGVANTQGRFKLGTSVYSTSQVTVHPQYNANAEPDLSNDIALYKLSQAVTNVPSYPIYRSAPQVGQVLTLVGFGEGGTGATGGQGDFGTKRVGTTPIDAVTTKMVWWNFDNESESNTAPGDSGGPAYLNVNGTYYVAGITSGGSKANAGLGDESYDTRVDAYAAWIDSIVGGTVSLPTVSLVATDASAAETASGVTANPGVFTVSRTGATTAALTVNFTVAGTATNGVDYTQLTSSVVIPAGSASGTVRVTPLDDSLVESTETVSLTLAANATYTVNAAQSSAVVSILDNDVSATPTVSLVATDATAAETASGMTANPGVFTVSRTGATTAALTVNFTVAGTATNGADYTTLGSSIVIPAGSVSATITVTPLDDSLVESTETVSLTLAASSSYTVNAAQASAVVSILDNDVSTTPTNDNFANRLAITGGQVTASNASATRERSEPKNDGAPGGKSLWWSWTAATSGMVVITTAGSSFDTTLGVYTGTALGSLKAIASNDDDPAADVLTSRVRFSAVAGRTYQISVDGYDGESGTIVLTVNPTAATNDAFANRVAITGTQVTASNADATREVGEPKNDGAPGGKSLWWSWTAATSGTVVITTAGSSFDTTLGVYTGTALGSLKTIASNDDDPAADVLTSRVRFSAVAGRTYQISVDGYYGDSGTIVLTVTPPAASRVAATPLATTGAASSPTPARATAVSITSAPTTPATPPAAPAGNGANATASRTRLSVTNSRQVDLAFSQGDSLSPDPVEELFR